MLIKVVLQAMPTYTMGCFKLPRTLCKDIEMLIRKFWWGYKVSLGKHNGLDEKNYVCQNAKGVWGSRILKTSIWLC